MTDVGVYRRLCLSLSWVLLLTAASAMAGREEEVSGQAVERSKGVRRRMIDDAVTVRGRSRRIWQTDQGVGSVMCLTVERIVQV